MLFEPVLELTRGGVLESVHYGAAAVVDVRGRLRAWIGNPDASTFIRSAAKPFQVLPLLEGGGAEYYGLTERDIALICASHSGTDEHISALQSLQKKVHVDESALLCGVHYPLHRPTAKAMRAGGKQPTPNRHNCSGKHTGMLAFLGLKRQAGEALVDTKSYIDPENPIQQQILNTFTAMCDIPASRVQTGIDGCSAPNFRLPLRNVALAFARLADPAAGEVKPVQRLHACRMVCKSMMAYPEMVAGPDRFDTAIMQVCRGRILAKGGAEGYQGISLMQGVLGPDSPALGVAVKIADGDRRGTAKPAVVLEILRQVGALTETDLVELADFGPRFELKNWRDLLVGEGRPCFKLNYEPES